MTRLLLVLVTCGLWLAACGPDDDGAVEADPPSPGRSAASVDVPQTTRPEPAADPSAGVPSADRILAAQNLIQEMARAYQSAPALIDSMRVEGSMGGQAMEPAEFEVLLGPGTDAAFRSKAGEMIALGDTFYYTVPAMEDRYLAAPLVDDMLGTLSTLFRAYRGMMPQVALRHGRSLDEVLYNLTTGMPGRPRLDNYRIITDNDGRKLEQIALVTPEGSATVNVDPVSKLIVSTDMEYLDPKAPIPNFKIARHTTFDPRVVDRLPEPITFDPAGRMAVSTGPELMGRAAAGRPDLAIEDGDSAPTFKLFTLEGERVDLAEARGSVVVLAFWSNWSIEARTAQIPRLLEMMEDYERVPVLLLPVNTLRRQENKGRHWENAFEYWEQQSFALPSLIDPDGEVAELYGLTVLPVTIVVDPDGRVVGATGRSDGGLVTAVREMIERVRPDDGS